MRTLLIRALGAAAFTLLNVILSIGPLARFDRPFLPLLCNRRHLGVMMYGARVRHADKVVPAATQEGDVVVAAARACSGCGARQLTLCATPASEMP